MAGSRTPKKQRRRAADCPITFVKEAQHVPFPPRIFRRILGEVARREGWQGEVVVAVVDDHRISQLNERFLGRRRPTDVLAFPYGDEQGARGEIVVSAETALRVAQELGLGAQEELLRYMIHGLLHLCGFRDKTRKEREEMFRKESSYLAELYHKTK